MSPILETVSEFATEPWREYLDMMDLLKKQGGDLNDAAYGG